MKHRKISDVLSRLSIHRMFKVNVISLAFIFCCFTVSIAQETINPLRNLKWFTTGAGITNADGTSWTAASTYGFRSEIILSEFRLAYSQELFPSPDDSCLATKSKSLEMSAMWGDGWGDDGWYAFGTVGMGLIQRWYCDDIAGDATSQPMSRLTFGLPAQVEVGFRITDQYKVALMGVANWNLLEPYVGGMICVSYWPAKKRK